MITAPFFEIGPKNLLRLPALEALAVAAGRAGAEHGVEVLLTVPTAFVAPVQRLGAGVVVLAQGMDTDRPGPSVNRVTAEALVDAGAAGVLLDHEADRLDPADLQRCLERAREVGLATVVCAGTTEAALDVARGCDVVLYEPPDLIGTAADGPRDWIGGSTAALRRANPGVLVMHAGGVASPRTARAVLAAGADGTGSTSGVLTAPDPAGAARAFIAATRSGWDAFRTTTGPTTEPLTEPLTDLRRNP
ncbi:triose-phosphate isomerase [Kineococcus rhizosphaerae]|uniref:Triosephosphate isomerase n=1 Tax=Kineococcus rhizosphaerae TaxID=559628 RepID=A0A2T0RBK6_9ACTN|nr:triose-phosphate isomerase [Kineococcus rhizosphaerae]PRY18554.1 triosephosphate isomerase [Kineococcus rhizosphaerae]